MPKTARDLILQAAKTAGVIDAIESLEAEEASHALEELNNILEQWNIDELFPYVNEFYDVLPPTLESGKILIGPTTGSVDVEAPRPNRVIAVAVLNDSRYYPLEYVSPNTMASSGFRNVGLVAALPVYYTVQPTLPDLTIEIYPIASGYTYQVTSQVVVQAYNLNTEVELPQGYYPALQYELASVLAAIYGNGEMVPQLEKMAKERIARVKRLNNKPRLLGHDGTPVGSGYWDIYTDTYT